MKNVLCIFQHFPPLIHPACTRNAGLVKFLPRSGWRPIVLCPGWDASNCLADQIMLRNLPDEVEIFRIDRWQSWGLDSVCDTLGADILTSLYPNSYLERGRRKIRLILDKFRVDAIWSSWPAASSHLLARWVKREFGLPWIADFHDVLGQYYINPFFSLINPLRKAFEARMIKEADLLTTASEGMAQSLRARNRKPVVVLPNGFDPDAFSRFSAVAKSDRFTVLFTGSIMAQNNRFRDLLNAFEILVGRGEVCLENLQIRFYILNRNGVKILQNCIREHPLESLVEIRPAIPLSECRVEQSKASVLLQNTFPDRKGMVVTSKIYDYLGTGRPILAYPSDFGSIEKLLAETGAGKVGNSVAELVDALGGWYREWQAHGNTIQVAASKLVEKYSWKTLAGKAAQELNRVAGMDG